MAEGTGSGVPEPHQEIEDEPLILDANFDLTSQAAGGEVSQMVITSTRQSQVGTVNTSLIRTPSLEGGREIAIPNTESQVGRANPNTHQARPSEAVGGEVVQIATTSTRQSQVGIVNASLIQTPPSEVVVAGGDFKNVNFGPHTSISHFEARNYVNPTFNYHFHSATSQEASNSASQLLNTRKLQETTEPEEGLESTSPLERRCQTRLASSTEGIVDESSTAFSQVELEGPWCDPQANFLKRIEEEIEQTLKESSTTSGGIGKRGGEIELDGCKVIFELNAFDNVISVSFTVALKQDIAPDGLYGITPAVKCSTGGIQFRGLATIQLTTFCSVDDASIVVLCKKGMNADWERLDVTTRSENATISFQVPHFCWYKVFTKTFWPTPMKMLLHNYLYYDVETSSICALTCKKNDTVIEKCFNILSKKGYRQNAFVGHENIQPLENERMRYQLACEHPAGSRIYPVEETRYLGSTFKRSGFEIKIFCLRPAPSVDIAQISYTLLTPNKNPKVTVLPLKWGVLQPQRTATIVGDVTAFVENIDVCRSTIAFCNDLFGDEIYQISGNQKKGGVLIINNDFQNTREGSEVDVRNMVQLWEGLGFETEKQLNLTAQGMRETCRQFATDCKNISVVVVIIMTHGGKRPDGKEYFMGEDDKQFLLEDLLALFSANTSPHLRGIPKVFLFQACLGPLQDHHQEQADTRDIHMLCDPQRADMLIGYPTQPGYQAIRNRSRGSWFINAVTRVFMEHAHNTHLLDMLTRVNAAVAREVTSDHEIHISVQTCLTKNLYLFPGWPEESPERETQDDEKSNEDIVEKPNQDETVPSEVGVSDPLQQDESADSDKKVPVEKSDGATVVLRDLKQDNLECASIHDIMECAVKKDWLQKAVASATIGHVGGKIELHDFEVIVPSGAISEEMKFEMSIDNNPENYPENEDPLSPILQVDPHVNFERPVTVRMRTYVSAAAGELYASILYREDSTDSSWTHFKDVVITDQNEVECTVRHFTGFIATCKEKLGISRPVFHRFIDVYVQKGTGTILVMYLKDKKTARKLQRDELSQDYQRAIPLLRRVSSTIASQIPVQIECKKPSGVTYVQELLEGRHLTLHAENFPENYEGSFIGVLSMELGENKVEEKLSTNLQPPRVKTQTPSPARSSQTHIENLAISTFVEHQGDKYCDKRETNIAQKMATKHGQISSEESAATNNTQNIGKDLS